MISPRTAHLYKSLQFATRKKLLPTTFSGKHPASTCQWSGRACKLVLMVMMITIDVKIRFYVFFIVVTFFYVLTFFYFPNVFFIFKKRWQSPERQAD